MLCSILNAAVQFYSRFFFSSLVFYKVDEKVVAGGTQ